MPLALPETREAVAALGQAFGSLLSSLDFAFVLR